MQDDISHRIIALSVRSARLLGIVLQSALRSYLESKRHKHHDIPHGKQTLKKLME